MESEGCRQHIQAIASTARIHYRIPECDGSRKTTVESLSLRGPCTRTRDMATTAHDPEIASRRPC